MAAPFVIGMAFVTVARTKSIPIMKTRCFATGKTLSCGDLEVMAAICPAIGNHSFKIGEVMSLFRGMAGRTNASRSRTIVGYAG